MADKTLTLEERTKKCINEIKAALDRFEMDLDLEVVLKAGSVNPKISVIPRPIKESTPEPTPEPVPEEIKI